MSGKYMRFCFKQNSSAPHFEDPALGGSRHTLVLGASAEIRGERHMEGKVNLLSNFKRLFLGIGTLEFISRDRALEH
jgi:hypothetical protein